VPTVVDIGPLSVYHASDKQSAAEIDMDSSLKDLPVDVRIRLVEELWDSIAADQNALPLTVEQQAELDRRLDAYETDGEKGRSIEVALSDIRRRL
jgi:putative addiction module component (TIGR02574 family)